MLHPIMSSKAENTCSSVEFPTCPWKTMLPVPYLSTTGKNGNTIMCHVLFVLCSLKEKDIFALSTGNVRDLLILLIVD
jgi:hypothetical protein